MMLSLRSISPLCLLVLGLWAKSVEAFLPSSPVSVTTSQSMMTMDHHHHIPLFHDLGGSTELVSVLDGLKGPIQSYVNIWTPLFQQAQDTGLVPDFLLHWGHGAAMATVLLTMGVIGAYFGWQIRLGNGNDVNALTLGETIREAHPKIIGGALFFFLLGGQGGLVLYDFQGGDILSSPHAVTAITAIGLMGVQAILPKFFASGGQTARDVHAYLGTATMAVLFAHLATGINLGLSF
ncbi:DUF4079 domain containing protein [Nitzschia inconspicua]|uniref:DUF4079 domain containing protein n=1 Tax=Nitzschia inconspicua TaxID=303405 RepID=A0A9K3KIP4_9STRA|nr:DUF4079 domain containing protein [Nitzschia inconspicua]KAG7344435.1 DUF4079 domain containing protein [Nitzschia inconspicua]